MNRRAVTIITGVSLLILMQTACSNSSQVKNIEDETEISVPTAATKQADEVMEHSLIEFPLPTSVSSASMEYSGLAWYGDILILLPQYPNGINGNQDGFLYAIDQENLSAYLDDSTAEIPVNAIPFEDAGIPNQLKGFEGFEAITFIDNSVYLTIETHGGDPMKSFVVKGSVDSDESGIKAIQLDGSSLVELIVQNSNSNASYEALTSDGKFIYAFFEQNGEAQNASPYAVRLDSDLHNMQEIPMDFINYRLTDATLMDDEGAFWMINYFFPGDTHLRVKDDPLSTSFGLGETHQKNEPVERLVKINLTQAGFVLANEPPLYLQLLENDEARNWEGIARFGEQGFLLITDKFPDSILGYIKIK